MGLDGQTFGRQLFSTVSGSIFSSLIPNGVNGLSKANIGILDGLGADVFLSPPAEVFTSGGVSGSIADGIGFNIATGVPVPTPDRRRCRVLGRGVGRGRGAKLPPTEKAEFRRKPRQSWAPTLTGNGPTAVREFLAAKQYGGKRI